VLCDDLWVNPHRSQCLQTAGLFVSFVFYENRRVDYQGFSVVAVFATCKELAQFFGVVIGDGAVHASEAFAVNEKFKVF